MKAAPHFRCPTCSGLRRPELEPIATLRAAREVAESILTESLNWHSPMRHTKVFGQLTMDEVCHLAVFMMHHEVPELESKGNITGESLRNMLVERWFQVFGRPSVIRCDPDSALMSKESTDLCGELGVLLLP